VHLRVGGFTIRIAWSGTEPHGLRLAPSPAAVPFLVDPQPPAVTVDITVDVAVGTTADDGARECLFDSGGPWRLYRHDDGFLFRFFASTFGARPYKTARVAPDFSRGHVTLDRDFFAGAASIDPLEYPLDELLVIALLAQGRGLEIHGCGVADRHGRGYLFVGQSGAGKSTMARLWTGESGAVILSDDRIVIRRHGEEVWMYGTPWHGEAPLASPSRARLDALFFLRHGQRNEVQEVGGAGASARLVAASFPPFHDRRGLAFTLEFLEWVTGRIPCRELSFVPGKAVLPLVRSSGAR
jgi:hypothetical protein